jgi:hypothetical protein
MEDLQLTMRTTTHPHCEWALMSEAEMSAVCGGDTFARDAGQFLGGAFGFLHEHPIGCATATMLFPPAGLLMALVAGVEAAVDN